MSVEHEALWTEITQLRRQLEAVQQVRGRTGRRLLLFLGGIVAGLIAAQVFLGQSRAMAQDDAQEVICRSLKLVDAEGKNMVFMGTDEDGGFVKIAARDGRLRAYLAVNNKMGPGFLTLYGNDQKPLVIVDSDADGGSLRIHAKDGNQRVYLGIAPNVGGGLLNLFDTNKRIRLILEGANAGGIMEKR